MLQDYKEVSCVRLDKSDYSETTLFVERVVGSPCGRIS